MVRRGNEKAIVTRKYNGVPLFRYHRRFNRVTSIEDCEINDSVCKWEANMQYKVTRIKLMDRDTI